MQREDLVIIGAGPGGVSAAVQARRLGWTPLLLDREGKAGGLTRDAFSIENYPGIGPTGGPAFAALLERHLRRFGLEVTRGEITDIERAQESFIVRLGNDAVQATALIVAVGTTPRRLGVIGTEHVAYSPRPSVKKGHKVVFVVGGGEAALDFALSLAAANIVVKLLVRGESLRARGRLADEVALNSRIEIWRHTRILEVSLAESGFDVRVSRQNVKWIERVDSVIGAVGRRSSAPDLLQGLDVGNEKTVTTRLPGLFLVGDARTGTLGQAGMAVGDGLAAGMAAAALLETWKI